MWFGNAFPVWGEEKLLLQKTKGHDTNKCAEEELWLQNS